MIEGKGFGCNLSPTTKIYSTRKCLAKGNLPCMYMYLPLSLSFTHWLILHFLEEDTMYMYQLHTLYLSESSLYMYTVILWLTVLYCQ